MTALIFDTEWTDRESREVIEVAWLRFPDVFDLAGPSDRIPEIDLPKATCFREFYKPTRPISYGAMAVHHILPHELENCAPSGTFELPPGVEYLVGHSVDEDWKAIGSPANVKRICTRAIADWLWPEADSYALSALLYMLNGPNEITREMVRGAHSAYRDVFNTAVLLHYILKARPEIETWSQLWAYSEECRIPRVMPLGVQQGVKGVTIDEAVRIDPSFCEWCLEQHFVDEYLKRGIRRAFERMREAAYELEDDDEADDDESFF